LIFGRLSWALKLGMIVVYFSCCLMSVLIHPRPMI